ncbi:hypothetical protein RRG08_028198 [Elysia crispata]|uniref:Cilia- and flagella-associated protein 126 n=1 Tax=Elysia crispata TaxID=231223 RepID=A0AAE1B7S2_9GAST|nr:hypothetical protein RRG08_028198 [Elysia crispata]
MSINFHANQYEQAFTPHKIQNWEIPKNTKGKHPEPQSGFTRIKANDRGHLLTNVPKERSSPWGTFVGTWDMPNKIPGNRTLNPTARCEDAVLKAASMKEKTDVVINGAIKRCHTVDPLPVKMDAPESQRPAGMVCQPGSGAGGEPQTTQPCIQVETTHCSANQPRAMSRKESRDSLRWPKAKSPVCHSPVGNAQSPKPVTPMCVAEENVQQEAEQRVSPLAPKEKNAVIGGLNTPDADLQRRADKPPTPGDRITGMKSPTNNPVDGSNPQAEGALIG